MIEGQRGRKKESLLLLTRIVSAARRKADARQLSDEELRLEVLDWAEILSEIPANRLEECHLRAIRERTVKGLLQPGELYQVWKLIRQEDYAKGPTPIAVVGESCFYCDGSGWQCIEQKAEGSNAMNSYSRPCACSAAPKSRRSEFPLREPEWRRRKNSSVWEKAPVLEIVTDVETNEPAEPVKLQLVGGADDDTEEDP